MICIPFIKKQTYQNIEIITIKDEKLKGAAWARNRGIEKALGEYIFFCDNDIELRPNAISELYLALKDSKYAWAFGKFYINRVLYNQNRSNIIPVNNFSWFRYFYNISTMSLVRSSAKPFFDEYFKRYDDYDLWLTLDKSGHKGLFVDTILFSTVIKQGNISSGNDEVYWMDKLRSKHCKDRGKIADIIIPHHNRHDHLKNCLEHLDNKLFNIIIVSGGSFAENCNKGAKLATTNNLIFLNDDTIPDVNRLQEMIEADGDMVGIAQVMPKYGDVIFYGIGYRKNNIGMIQAGLSRKIEDTSIPSGYCFLFRKSAWKKLGGLNEDFKNGGEDQDIGFRAIESGMKISYIRLPMIHYESQSEGRFSYGRDNELLIKKLWPDDKLIKLLKL